MPTNTTARCVRFLAEHFRYPALFIVFLFIYSLSHSQTYYFDTYGATEGVSSKVYCILQDHQNNIWLGTRSGVARFDGNKFENFNEENGLAAQAVRCMIKDKENCLWFGHRGGGISVYYNQNFRVFPHLDSLIESDVTSIFEDKLHRMWITTSASGAFLMEDPHTSPGKFIHFSGKDKLSDRVYNYCVTEDNSIYLITDVGIRKFDENEHRFTVFHPRGLTTYFMCTTIYEDRSNNLWFGTYNGGLYKYEPANDTVLFYDKRDGLSYNWISTIMQDRNENLWIGTFGGGISRLNQHGFKTFDKTNGLEAEEIFSIIEDVEGNILIGSSNKGFSIYKGDLIENYGQKEGLNNLEVFAIMQDNNKDYWIGTNSGITVLPRDLNIGLPQTKNNEQWKALAEDSKDIKVRFLNVDQEGTIWIGTDGSRVLYYDNSDQKIRDAFNINRWFSGSDSKVTAMDIDQDNNLWVGTGDGLVKYNVATEEVVRYSNDNGLVGNNISSIYCDAANQIWVGADSEDGISKINKKGIVNYPCKSVLTPTCFVLDNNEKLWIGTNGKGVFLLQGDSVENQAEITAGLLSNLISTLNVDDNNTIYIGSHYGLNVLDQNTHNIKTYNQKNGFLGIETNPSASYYDKTEKYIWFGTNLGINKYNITETKTSPPPPLVYITNLHINQAPRAIEPKIRLRFYENQIRISYKSICLTNSDAVRYRFIMEGLDEDWQETTSQTSITYQALSPDKYRFKVISRNSEGVWSNTPAQLDIIINTPLYKRWYIILLTLLTVFGLFWLYVKLREKNLIKEKRILEAKVRDRTVKLEEANIELADKNKDITDSIRYALRIQLSILPPEIPFQNMFVLFKPKDIVSGDFYWLANVNKKEIVAAIDCTGHGVPGAFMSFIGYSSLNEVVKEKQITKPSSILDNLNDTVVSALNLQGDEAIKDGMDLAVICYDPSKNELDYSGAYNPIYLIRDGELQEIKADRFAIGKSSVKDKKFTNHTIKIHKGDIVYIFSDGYADQFGGEENKKFKSGQVKKLLLSIHKNSMAEQKRILDDTIENWRGDEEQIDDILFIGRKF